MNNSNEQMYCVDTNKKGELNKLNVRIAAFAFDRIESNARHKELVFDLNTYGILMNTRVPEPELISYV